MLGMTGLGPLDKEPDPDFKKEMEEKELNKLDIPLYLLYNFNNENKKRN